MTEVVLAAALVSGRPTALATAALVASTHVVPPWVVAIALVAWARRLRSPADAEVAFFSSAGAHLAVGTPLRAALLLASEGADLPLDAFRRRLGAGVPLDRCARVLAGALPGQGRVLAHALIVSARSGGRLGPLMDRLAERAAADLDLRREARTASATARASVALLGGAPLLLAMHRLPGEGGGTGLLIAAGGVLILLGTAIGWGMVRGVRP